MNENITISDCTTNKPTVYYDAFGVPSVKADELLASRKGRLELLKASRVARLLGLRP